MPKGSGPAARRANGANAGYKIRYKEGYFPVPPADTLQDVRTEMMLALQECGVEVEAQHHEVATAGQCEIDMKYGPLLRTADNLIRYKYVVKNVAARHGKTATFMPKPVWNDNGSGLHLHLSLWKKGEPLFAGSGYGGLSQMALYAIGGILKHSASLCSPSAARRPTATSGSSRASRRRSTSRTATAIARRPSAFPCTPRARPTSGSSTAAPTRRRIRTWRCRPC